MHEDEYDAEVELMKQLGLPVAFGQSAVCSNCVCRASLVSDVVETLPGGMAFASCAVV